MNDSEFIELVNLYLDHEISAADATRLEAEVQRSPARRGLYREYCKMQKACWLIAEQAAKTTATTDEDPAQVGLPSRAWGLGYYAAGFCAVAAGIALVLVVRTGHGSAVGARQTAESAGADIVQITPARHEVIVRRDFPLTVSVNPRLPEQFQSSLSTRSLALPKQARVEGPLPSSPDSRFEWLHRVNVTSLQRADSDSLRFESAGTFPPDSRTYRSKRTVEGVLEQAAFQFQR